MSVLGTPVAKGNKQKTILGIPKVRDNPCFKRDSSTYGWFPEFANSGVQPVMWMNCTQWNFYRWQAQSRPLQIPFLPLTYKLWEGTWNIKCLLKGGSKPPIESIGVSVLLLSNRLGTACRKFFFLCHCTQMRTVPAKSFANPSCKGMRDSNGGAGYFKSACHDHKVIMCVCVCVCVVLACLSPLNVNPALVNPWLINRGVSPFSGDSDHFWRGTPPNNGTGLLILGQHYGAKPLIFVISNEKG